MRCYLVSGLTQREPPLVLNVSLVEAAEFEAENRDDDEEVLAVVRGLKPGEATRVGGGAAALFVVVALDVDLKTVPEPGPTGPYVLWHAGDGEQLRVWSSVIGEPGTTFATRAENPGPIFLDEMVEGESIV